jgi:DNA-binding LacI/PurR family transcriptional regulator
MGQEAANLLLESIGGKKRARHQITVPPELIIRRSCGAQK